ncbi:MAG TPA: NYN domain-containing protein [Microlunatus sp.]
MDPQPPVPDVPPPPADTVIFIDAAYLLTALAEHHGSTLSTTIFDSRGIASLVGATVAARLGAARTADATPLDEDHLELRWYDGIDPAKRVETPWVSALRNHPRVRLRLGRTTIREDHRLEQKRVDTLLVADVIEAVYAADPPDDVVIVSGDEDMTPALDIAVAKGVRAHLVTVVVDGARQGVSQHLRLSATSELPVDITDLAPLAKSRSRMFAQMQGLPAEPPRKPDVGKGSCGHEDGGGIGGTAAEHAEQQEWTQPVLPGMPPDPPRWAEEIDTVPSIIQGDLMVAEQSSLEDRVRAGQVSRAYLAGRAYGRRWWTGTEPDVRAAQVAMILANHPYLPNSVDKGLMRFAAHHVAVSVCGRYNRVDVRAGFSAAVRRLAGVSGPDGSDAEVAATRVPETISCAISAA